jgi:parvulin-like peptidyl-prolyl isomerase
MIATARLDHQTMSANDLLSLLAGYRLLPQLRQELLIDQAISTVECVPEEVELACQQFCEQHQIAGEAERQAWLQFYGMTPEQLQATATRALRLEKFKQATWERQLESHFLTQKSQLDKVVYSLLRTSDLGIAQELFFRIHAGEAPFADLAREYSEGPEAQTGGLLGPVELTQPHPALAKILATSQPGQLHPPTRLGDWYVIIRLEKRLAAQLDTPTRQRLLDGLFEKWMQEQLATSNPFAHSCTP